MAFIRECTFKDVENMYRWCVQHNRHNLPVDEFVKSSLRKILLSMNINNRKYYYMDVSDRKIYIGFFEEEWSQIDRCMETNPTKI